MSFFSFKTKIVSLFLSGVALCAVLIATNSIQVAAHFTSGFGCCDTHIDESISITPNTLPFGKVFPEEVLLKPLSISLSNSCISDKKIEKVEYQIVEIVKPKKASDEAYCQTHPTDLTKCYPSLCPYLSNEPDNKPANDTGVSAFHDPNSPAGIANGVLSSKTDKDDKWMVDLHVPCFKGQCAQDNVIPKAYEANPTLSGKEFACNFKIVINKTGKDGGKDDDKGDKDDKGGKDDKDKKDDKGGKDNNKKDDKNKITYSPPPPVKKK